MLAIQGFQRLRQKRPQAPDIYSFDALLPCLLPIKSNKKNKQKFLL